MFRGRRVTVAHFCHTESRMDLHPWIALLKAGLFHHVMLSLFYVPRVANRTWNPINRSHSLTLFK